MYLVYLCSCVYRERREREKIQPLTTCFTTRYQHDRSSSTTRAEGVVIKLDAGNLVVVHAIGYFDDVDYFNVASDRICSDSSSRRQVPGLAELSYATGFESVR